MSDILGVGIVGCGVVTVFDIIPNLLDTEVEQRIRLVAVADNLPNRAKEIADKFNIPKHYDSAEDLCQDKDVDIVVIATPVPSHLPNALSAIRSGKHIYIQKTMTLTVEEANIIIDAARKAGVKVAAAPGNHLRSRAMQEIRDHIREGKIGKICWGRAQRGARHEDDIRRQPGSELEHADPSWYYKPGGGPLRDAAVYDLHAITWILGPARRVVAMSGVSIPIRFWQSKEIKVEMDDNTHFILEFDNSCFFVISSHFIRGCSKVPSMEIYGDDGAIIYGGCATGSYELWVKGSGRNRLGFEEVLAHVGAPEISGAEAKGTNHYIVGDILHLADCVIKDKAPEISAEHARHVIEIIQGVYDSARSGKAVELKTSFNYQH